MTHPFPTRRVALLTVSAALAAGSALVPATAFAATPAAPPTARADRGDGDNANLLYLAPPGAGSIFGHRPQGDPPTGEPPVGREDAHGTPDDPGVFIPPRTPQWRCVAAPCGPPGH